MVLLVGLAVGVDYAMFYLRREREERARGLGSEAALQAAAATSGRAVLVSGITVAIAMAGMYFAGAATFTSFATGTILVVAIAVLGSLTVLPAVLSKLGDRVNKGRVPFLTPPQERAARESRLWGAILDRVLRRPWIAGGAALALLLVMAIPVLGLKMQVPGIDTLPRDLEVMKTYDEIQASFPGDQIPATAVIEPNGASPADVRAGIAALEDAVAGNDELFVAEPTVEVSDDRSVVAVDIPIAGDGGNDASYAALAELREDIVPATLGQIPGAEVNVTGITAGSEDFNQIMEERVPIVFGLRARVAFLLLLGTFRSIVIPIKAIVLNLLSVGAAYGLVVWIFQEGNLESLLGFESTGAVTSWLPLFLFVILFGLSMDYHVFILSRVREAYDRGLATGDAVAHRDQEHGVGGDRRGGRDDRGVRDLRDALVDRVQAVRRRPCCRDPDRRDDHPRRPAAGDDEAARRLELVPAELARVAAEVAIRGGPADAGRPRVRGRVVERRRYRRAPATPRTGSVLALPGPDGVARRRGSGAAPFAAR